MTNQGASFSTPIILKTGWGQGTNVQTGPNGEVYVCWADYDNSYADLSSKGLGFCRSTNGGVSFTTSQRVINYTGIRTLNPVTGDDENPLFHGIKVNDFPAMAVDKSNGPHRGRIYVALPVKENGNGKAVIQLSFSEDQGTTWSTPFTISIANGRQNWFPWITDDDTNGNLYIIYYSLDGTTGFSTNTYVAESDDGGATFTNKLVSDVAHTTAPIQGFLYGYAGDYIGITAYGGKAYAAWMDNRTGQWQNYVSQVTNLNIAGGDYFCTNGTYSISNLPNGGTVSWSISPASGMATLSQSNNQATLTKVANGTVTLTANVTSGCGTPSQISKSIEVGGPIPALTGTYSTASNTLPMQTVNFVPVGNIFAQYQWPGVSNISAALGSGSPPGTGFYSYPNHFSFNISSGQNVSVIVSGNNVCGRPVNVTLTFIQSSYYFLVASPNPTTGDINVSIREVEDTTEAMAKKQSFNSPNSGDITKMYLYDFNTGILIKQWSFPETKSNNYNLNIVGVKSGMYVLKMERNNKSTSTKIIVK